MKSADAATKKQALIDAKSSQHALVTAALCKSVHDDDEATRTAVLDALAARTDDAAKKSAAVAVAARLDRIVKQKDTAAERLRVIAALHRLAQPASIKSLAADTGFDVPADELRARLLAIANVPCKEAVEEVISFALTGGRPADGQDERRRTAAAAFVSATGEDCGHDAIKMSKWWKEHEKTFEFRAAAERRAKEATASGGKGRLHLEARGARSVDAGDLASAARTRDEVVPGGPYGHRAGQHCAPLAWKPDPPVNRASDCLGVDVATEMELRS